MDTENIEVCDNCGVLYDIHVCIVKSPKYDFGHCIEPGVKRCPVCKVEENFSW